LRFIKSVPAVELLDLHEVVALELARVDDVVRARLGRVLPLEDAELPAAGGTTKILKL
jgi:hypothetical protein